MSNKRIEELQQEIKDLKRKIHDKEVEIGNILLNEKKEMYPFKIGDEVEYKHLGKTYRLCMTGFYRHFSGIKARWTLIKKDGELGMKSTQSGIYLPHRYDESIEDFMTKTGHREIND